MPERRSNAASAPVDGAVDLEAAPASPSALSDEALWRLLEDDVPCGDLTSDTLGIGERPGRATFFARRAMIACGVEEAARLFALAGCMARIEARSGTVLAAGAAMLRVAGAAGSLHRAWKTAQVLVEWASGIATAAGAIVSAAGIARVACTRKNVPGTKIMSAKAVRVAGATMHRLGLSETLLIFPEHRLFSTRDPRETIAIMHRQEPEKRVVAEVGSAEEALEWARAGADLVQLERFAPSAVAACKAAFAREALAVKIAVAGGVSATNAAAYAAAGADVLVTSAPFAAAPMDVRVEFANA